jgi:hypothetical protein
MRNKVLLIDITFDPSLFSLDSPFKLLLPTVGLDDSLSVQHHVR